MTTWAQRVLGSRLEGRASWLLAAARVLSGVVFVLFSVGKFTRHEEYIEEFVSYGLPSSSLLVYLVGLLELSAGLLLILGLLSRLAALGLFVDMVGAIATAGVQVGGAVNLVLAPVLAVLMLLLLWAGPGPYSIDERLARRY